MANLDSYDHLLTQLAADNWLALPWWGEIQSATVAFGGNAISIQRIYGAPLIPTLGGALTQFMPTVMSAVCNRGQISLYLGRATLLGSINLATAVFSYNTAMPTLTMTGSSTQTAGPILLECQTALTGTLPTCTVKYQDQSGNSTENATAVSLPAAGTVGSCGFVLLNSGDWGAIDIDHSTGLSLTGGSSPTGTLRCYGLEPITLMPLNGTSIGGIRQQIISSFRPLRLLGGDQIMALILGETTIKAVVGSIYGVCA